MKLPIMMASLLLFSEAYANNFFIPNYYRNRVELNNFSAIGWSHRNEAVLNLSRSHEEETDDGVDEEETDTKEYDLKVFRRLNENMNFEGMISKIEEEQENFSFPFKDNSATNGAQAGLGYQFGNTPMAIGASYAYADTEGIKVKFLGLGWGTNIGNNLFFGLGYLNLGIDARSIHETTQIYSFGGGYVWGDLKNPTAATEVVVTMSNEDQNEQTGINIQGLWNMTEDRQIYGGLTSTQSESPDDELDSMTYRLGVHQELGGFYLGPEIILETEKENDGTSKTNEFLWSLEVGAELQRDLILAVAYNSTNSKRKLSPATSGPFETKKSEVEVELTYLF